MNRSPGDTGGFSLLEIIITILVAAVLGALMVEFAGTALTRSAEPVNLVRDDANVEAVMENIISDYVKAMNTTPNAALANIASTSYGTGVTMSYTEFTAGGTEVSPAPSSGTTLKVTVQGEGYRMTALLGQTRARSDDPPSPY